jgi:hypothetical protein
MTQQEPVCDQASILGNQHKRPSICSMRESNIRALTLLAVVASLAVTSAPAEELRLPAGSPEDGLKSFVALRCVHCHRVTGVPIQDPELAKRLDLTLGAEARFVRSYPDLITAITNPRHVIQKQYSQLLDPTQQVETEPFMLDLSREMTVRQLIDIVSFLDQRYAADLPAYTPRR